MEDLLLQIIRESNNARLQNLRKSAQEAHGECLTFFISIRFFVKYLFDKNLSYLRLLHFGDVKHDDKFDTRVSTLVMNVIAYIYILGNISNFQPFVIFKLCVHNKCRIIF